MINKERFINKEVFPENTMALQKELLQKDVSLREITPKLRNLGLNSYESKLWTALLSRGVSTAGELSDIANVPRSRSYDVLESLEKKGFIILKLGKPLKYVAVPPEDVLERVKKSIMMGAEAQTRLLDEVKDSPLLNELTLLYANGIEMVEPSDLSGVIKGRKNLYSHFQERISKAKESVILHTTSQGILRKYQALKNTLKKAKERNVRIRIAAPINNLSKEELSSLSKVSQIRNTTTKGRFCVIDGEEVTFMVLDDEQVHPNYDFGIWVKSELLAKSLQGFFDIAWEQMKPVK